MVLPKTSRSNFEKKDMLKKLALFTLIATYALLLMSCQTTEQAATQNNVVEEKQTVDSAPFIPNWVHSDNNLQADSSNFSVTVMASNADSVSALEMAKSQARSLLEHKLSELSEDQRVKIAKNNSSAAETEFIFQLRMAEEAIASGAAITKLNVKKDDNQYVGFTKIEIKRSSINSNLKSYFSDHSSKYSGVIDSFVFTQLQ